MTVGEKPNTRYPHARVSRRAVLSFIWVIPAIAAVVAAVLVFQNVQKFGPSVTIQFDDANGLEANQSVVRYRGIRVGSVSSVKLSPDLQHVEIRARLYRFAAGLAREGSIFWIVRPEVGAAGVHALETIVSGPYIEVLPGEGKGKTQDHFVGATEAPVMKQPGNGVEFVLHSRAIRSLGPDSPVYFRGLPAGKVLYLDLSDDSKTVNIHVVLKPGFASLVRLNTVWWNAGGIDVNWHLLSGVNVSAENLKALLTGGIAFATPNTPEGQAPAGTSFVLYDRPDAKWLEWSPSVEVTNAAVSDHANSGGVDLENVNQLQTPPQKQQ